MALPLRAEDRRLGVLFIARAPGRPVYRPSDVDRAADLAGQVTVAMGSPRPAPPSSGCWSWRIADASPAICTTT